MTGDGSDAFFQQVPAVVEVEVEARELRHPPAQVIRPFDEDHRVSGIGDVQGGGQPGDAPADDQRSLDDGQREWHQRLVVAHLLHDGAHRLDGLVGGFLRRVLVWPRDLLPNVGDLHLVGV